MPTKEWYKKNKDKSKAYNDKWRIEHKKYFAKYNKEYRRRPDQILKNKVRGISRYLIAIGRLPRQVCSIENCGILAEAHHYDYSKPLDILWLCKKHHEEAEHN